MERKEDMTMRTLMLSAFAALRGKGVDAPWKKHDTIPL